MSDNVRISSDYGLRLRNLRDAYTDDPLEDATVTWVLLDGDGEAVLDGSDQPVTGNMSIYDAAGASYEATVPRDVTALLSQRRKYSFVARVAHSGLEVEFPLEVVALARHKES